MALLYPKLYDQCRTSREFNLRVFLMWIAGAFFESIVIYIFCAYAYVLPATPSAVGGSGSPYIFELGTVAFTSVLSIVTIRIATEMNQHHSFFVLAAASSLLLWLPACFTFDAINADYMRGGVVRMFGSPTFWATLAAILGALVTRLLAWKSYRRFYMPEIQHIVQEVEAVTGDPTPLNTYIAAADGIQRMGRNASDFSVAQLPPSVGSNKLPSQLRLDSNAGDVRFVTDGTVLHAIPPAEPDGVFAADCRIDDSDGHKRVHTWAGPTQGRSGIVGASSRDSHDRTEEPELGERVNSLENLACDSPPVGWDSTSHSNGDDRSNQSGAPHKLRPLTPSMNNNLPAGGPMFDMDAVAATAVANRFSLLGNDNVNARAARVWLQRGGGPSGEL